MTDMDFAFLSCFVDDEEADRTLTFFGFLMPYIMMDSKTLSSQDVSVKRDLLQKALFVHKFMTSQNLSLMFVFYILEAFINKVKASLPEHIEVPELPEISKSGPRLTRMLQPVCQELEALMFPPPSRPDLGSNCGFGRCKFCGIGEHFYSDSDETINVEGEYTCPECGEQGL